LLSHPHAEQPLARLYPPYRRLLDPRDRRFWNALDFASRARRMDVAAIQYAGWYDVFCEGAIRIWRTLRAEAPSEYARASQRLVIGPWMHWGMLQRSTPEVDFGPAANGLAAGGWEPALRWLRDALDEQPVQGGIRVFVMGRGDWEELEDWPPPATEVALHPGSSRGARSLRGDGVLATRPGEAAFDRFLHDPADPVPTRGGRTLGPWLPVPGPSDQRPVEERGDVLVYTTPPLAEDVTIMGPVTGAALFATSGRSADVTMKLVDVHPDGRALNVLDSVVRSRFAPGRAKQVEVALGSVAQTFRRGHRIRLEVASSNFPRFDVNPSTGAAGLEVDRHEPAEQTLHHGGRTGTRLLLPVVAGELRF
ncbi:MAG TPA: CocE/NonD family hydrolase, partial [Gaiellaceae bacterium]|nr:CocE/NonD family hydrolase [Gaiellaceae bacterium]